MAPVVLILAQLDSRFAHRPFSPGETTLVTATIAPESKELLNHLILEAPTAVVVETLPVRDHLKLTATWRIRVTAAGQHELTLADPAGDRWTKRLVAGPSSLPRLAAARERAGWHHALLNPAESPLPKNSPVAQISLQLPPRQTHYLGIKLHWLLAFCAFSLLFGFALKDVFKVRI